MSKGTLFVDCKMSKVAVDTLKSLGYEVIKSLENVYLEEHVCSHPDMSLTKICDKIFADRVLEHLFFGWGDVNFINREVTVGEILKYPNSIAFNCVQVGNKLFCNEKYTHEEILNYALKCNLKIVNTKQGYAKCSICVVSDNAIITEDDSIEKCAIDNGVDVLKIKKGFVALDGYDYGFIGGASGLIERNLLVFNGNIETHPDFEKIKNFCLKYNVQIVSLCSDKLYDVGSIIKL